ncbi:hypothetical protein LC608_13445 [Nostoc sp. XA010]|uniref:hypothetical protein n=1 Tax=Nostoc sp. XA010 TaxID=2780407 RepID=UPI001E547B8C|nr:hypothetical protein [Nostoc sp. XA010]MCC5657975.1 hypothetical protein [Nostoc sp. XA010]
MIMIGETLGILLPPGSLVGIVIEGMIELLSVATPNREYEEYDVVDNQLFMIVHLDGRLLTN